MVRHGEREKIMNILGGYSGKQFTINILNGVALGIVTSLLPGAILSIPLKLLAPYWSGATVIMQAAQLCNSLMGVLVGCFIGFLFKFSPIQMGSVALATAFACGVGKFVPASKGWVLVGTGDVITMAVTAALAVIYILAISDKVKSFAVLVLPSTTLLIIGTLGYELYPYITQITKFIGQIVQYCIQLQPILMCITISMIFAIMIMSPITTVGIALAISLSGIGSGAANLGICAAGIGFCIAGWKVNSVGFCLAHWIGSPKISMPAMLSNPLTMLPILCTAIVLGILAAVFNIQGTPFSAGFGLSGFIGPIAAIDSLDGGWNLANTLLVVTIFGLVPIISSLFFNYIFVNVLKIVKPEDYKMVIE